MNPHYSGKRYAIWKKFSKSLRGCHPLWHSVPRNFRFSPLSMRALPFNLPLPYTTQLLKFKLYHFRSTLLTISMIFFLFLPLLRCFSSGRSLVSAHLGPTRFQGDCSPLHLVIQFRYTYMPNICSFCRSFRC